MDCVISWLESKEEEEEEEEEITRHTNHGGGWLSKWVAMALEEGIKADAARRSRLLARQHHFVTSYGEGASCTQEATNEHR